MGKESGYTTIKIDDPKRFLDVAALVDRPDFITDILVLRKKWKINKPYLRKKGQSWNELPLFEEQIPKKGDILKRVDETEKSLQFMRDMFILKDQPEEDLKYKEQVMRAFRKKESWKRFPDLYFRYDVMRLRKKYKKPPNFDQIIISTALYATVIQSDYKTCEIGLFYPGDSLWQVFHETQPTLTFYPLVTIDEVKTLFQKEGEKVLKKYQDKYLKGMMFDHDTISNVARDRKWFWLKKQGLSYSQILKKAYEEGERLTRDAVIKAIKRYSKLLTVDI